MRAYEIKIWPSDNDRTWRLVDVSDRQNLHHLNQVIREEFGLQTGHLYCFYAGDRPYRTKTAYGGPGAEVPRLATRTNLGSLGLKKGKRFVYVFDFTQDRYFNLTVQRVHGVSDNARLPRVVKRTGRAPQRSEPIESRRERELVRALHDLAPRLKAAAEGWSHGKRPPKSKLKEQSALAIELDERTRGAWAQITGLERQTGSDISGWLVALPEALAAEGLTEDALGIIERYAGLEPTSFLGDKALVLCRAGRLAEAKEEAAANTRRFPMDPWIWAKAADVFWSAGDPQGAEPHLRRALELAGNAIYLREGILERLLALLQELGKGEQAQELAEAESKRRKRSDRN